MIRISSATQQTYLFPARLSAAFDFFTDTGRILNLLPHISVVDCYSPTCYRMLYHTLEMSLYRINIYCDLESFPDPAANLLTFRPCQKGTDAVKAHAGLYTLTGQGLFSSQSRFSEEGEATRIDFSLKLKARLPVPLALRLMPGWMVEGLAAPVVERRIREIAAGFLQRAGADYAG
jgi:hypothetical protein